MRAKEIKMKNYNEIMEGLKCCEQPGCCDICPYNEINSFPSCLQSLLFNVHEIVEQQDRTIKEIQKYLNNQEESIWGDIENEY